MTTVSVEKLATSRDRILRITDVMALLKISRPCVYTWEKCGALPARRVFGPGLTGWFESELDEWLRTRPRVNAR